jgi:DNA-binding response OmpR family regulator
MSEARQVGWSYVCDAPVRILVVDDDPLLRELACAELSTAETTIVTAPDGVAALDALRATPCDFALLDIEMPRLDGFGLLARIRADSELRGLPVMMLTVHDDVASIDRAFTLGANAFSSKPVNWRLLGHQIRFVLRSCSLEQEIQAAGKRVATYRQACAENRHLRERCETILRDAREVRDAGGDAVALAACLQRTIASVSQIIEGDVFGRRDDPPALVVESGKVLLTG